MMVTMIPTASSATAAGFCRHALLSASSIQGASLVTLEHSSCFQCAVDPTLLFAFADGVAFVVSFLATDNREGELQMTLFSIHRKGDNCQALLRFGARNMDYFLLTQEQSAGAFGVEPLGRIGQLPGGDGRPHEVRFAATGDYARALERSLLIRGRHADYC